MSEAAPKGETPLCDEAERLADELNCHTDLTPVAQQAVLMLWTLSRALRRVSGSDRIPPSPRFADLFVAARNTAYRLRVVVSDDELEDILAAAGLSRADGKRYREAPPKAAAVSPAPPPTSERDETSWPYWQRIAQIANVVRDCRAPLDKIVIDGKSIDSILMEMSDTMRRRVSGGAPPKEGP